MNGQAFATHNALHGMDNTAVSHHASNIEGHAFQTKNSTFGERAARVSTAHPKRRQSNTVIPSYRNTIPSRMNHYWYGDMVLLPNHLMIYIIME
jgi:hypothetical protein